MMYYRRSRGLDVESHLPKEEQQKSSGEVMRQKKGSEVMRHNSNNSDSALSDSSTRNGWSLPESPFARRFSVSTAGQKSRVNSVQVPQLQAPQRSLESPFASRLSTSAGHGSRVNSHAPHRSVDASRFAGQTSRVSSTDGNAPHRSLQLSLS